MGKRIKQIASASGEKAQNAEFLTNDISVVKDSKLSISYAFSSDVDLDFTRDGAGTTVDFFRVYQTTVG